MKETIGYDFLDLIIYHIRIIRKELELLYQELTSMGQIHRHYICEK